MKIVALDAETLMVDGLDWSGMEAIGDLSRFERTNPSQLMDRAKDAEVLIVNKVKLDESQLHQLPKLKLIAVAATGFNVVDTIAARNLGITVCNVPAYSSPSVAQHCWALILHLSNHVFLEAKSVKDGQWNSKQGWSYLDAPITEWSGKTIGIVGLGQIGNATAKIAEAFGMRVIYHNRTEHKNSPYQWTELPQLFAQADIVSIHCPETEQNHQFVNFDLLTLMKPSAILINTSRGGLINETDLANALNNGILAAAALDVLSSEPPLTTNPLLSAKHCVITPHVAWASLSSKNRLLATLINNIKSFLDGTPINKVN